MLHEQGHICYFGEKLHFRDSGIDEISGSGSGLKFRRDPGIPIPGLQSLDTPPLPQAFNCAVFCPRDASKEQSFGMGATLVGKAR